MVEPVAICLIGFGEVGQTLADDLAAGGAATVRAFDTAFDDPSSRPSMAARARGGGAFVAASSHADAVTGARLVVCAVTADADLDAARSVAAAIPKGTFYLDMNSASPDTKAEAAALVDGAGGRYVEAAVMSPIGPKRIASPILLGGPHADAFVELGRRVGMSGARVFADRVGPASATKMCRSVIIKGMEALLSESLLAARHYGVEEHVLGSLGDLLPIGDWPRLARYMISRTLEHGERRAEEMREVAQTVAQAGFEPLMSSACALRQDWAPQHAAALGHATLPDMLDAIIASNRRNREEDSR